MRVRRRNGMLFIKLPMTEEPKMSKSGKVLLVASSKGPKRTAIKVQGRRVIVIVNAYIKPHGTEKRKEMKSRRKATSTRHRRLRRRRALQRRPT